MRSRRKSLSAVLCAAVALIVVGVASLGGSATAATPTEYKIMVSTPVTAPAYPNPEVLPNVQAAISAVNKKGGIKGVKIKVLTCDNGHNPNKAAQCAQAAVQNKVVAMVGNYTFLAAQGFYPTLERARIPSIGNGPGGPSDWSSPMSFPVSYSAQAYVAGPPIAMARNGCKRIATVGYDDPAYAPYFGFAKAGIAKAGVTNVGEVKFPASQTDFTATVQAVISRGADCIFTLGPDQSVPPIVRAIRNSGRNIRMGGLTHIYANLAGLKTQLNGAALVQPTPRPTLKPTSKTPAALKEYVADLKAIGKLTEKNISDNGLSAWIGAKYFIQLANSLPKGGVTAERLIAAGNKSKFRIPGVVGESDFTKAAPCPKSAPRIKNYIMYTKKVVNGKIVETGVTNLANLFKGLSC